jgi:hypothetical protein
MIVMAMQWQGSSKAKMVVRQEEKNNGKIAAMERLFEFIFWSLCNFVRIF